MRIILLSAFIFSSLPLISQPSTDLLLIKNIQSLRSQLLSDTTNNREYNSVLDKYQKAERNIETFTSALLKLHALNNIFKKDYRFILRNMYCCHPESMFTNLITIQDLEIIKKNDLLTQMIANKILLPDYPFNINLSDLILEVSAYHLKEKERVCIIGEGIDLTSLHLNLLDLDLEITSYDLNKKRRKYASKHLKKHSTEGSSFTIKKIKKNKIKITETFDKIIVSNTFQHFAKKKEMLAIIINSLDKNGSLFMEVKYDDDSQVTVDEAIEPFNLSLVAETKTEKYRLFEFIQNPK